MSAVLQEVLDQLAAASDDEGDGLHHLVCVFTDPDLTFCGQRIPGEPDEWFDPEDPKSCVVCEDLAGRRRCAKCGRRWEHHE